MSVTSKIYSQEEIDKSQGSPFPESQKATTFRIKRVNPDNFKFATNAHKRWFCKILCISLVQKCSIGSAYNRCPKFGTFRIVRKFSRSPQHISRSSGLFLDYMDWTHVREYPDTVEIVRKLSRSFTLFSDYPDTLSRFTGHF